ncbi:hypothetical protein EPYR_00846 [Erwinia pyrifoliae DSM 12163]|nr:hypothetical protein EPYR_00846 [Erwinia pyrifoliae DSM 12163]
MLNGNDNQQTDVQYLQRQQDCSLRYHLHLLDKGACAQPVNAVGLPFTARTGC